MPVHWLVRTRSRTCVARVSGMSNERRISSGARGRGATDGNASAGLVNTDVNCASCVQSTAAAHLAGQQLERAQRREAALRRRVAARVGRHAVAQQRADLDRAGSCATAADGSSSTVTCLPAIGESSDAQFVASVSSIRLAER